MLVLLLNKACSSIWKRNWCCVCQLGELHAVRNKLGNKQWKTTNFPLAVFFSFQHWLRAAFSAYIPMLCILCIVVVMFIMFGNLTHVRCAAFSAMLPARRARSFHVTGIVVHLHLSLCCRPSILSPHRVFLFVQFFCLLSSSPAVILPAVHVEECLVGMGNRLYVNEQ